MSADESIRTIPVGWSLRNLGDCVEFSPKITQGMLSSEQPLSFVPMAKVMEVSGRIDLDETISVTEGKRRNLTYFEDGDVIFAKITPCMENGKIARPNGLLSGAAFGSTEFHVLRPLEEIDGEYLRFFLVHDDFRYEAERAMTGAVGQRRVPKKYLESYQMVLPPLNEQKKIVEILEEQLSRLDAALASLRAAREKSARFRLSLIESCIHGSLSKQFSDSWTLKTFDDLVAQKGDIVDGPFGSNLKSEHYVDNGARVIRLQNIGYGEFRDAESYVSLERFEFLKKHDVQEGDLLFASLGESLPRTCLLPKLGSVAIVKADCIRIRLSPEVNNRFVLYATQSLSAKAWASRQLHGLGRPRLGLGNIRNFPVRVPDGVAQKLVVEYLDSQLSKLDASLAIVEEIETKASAFRRSLLNAAFSGKLTEEWREGADV